MNPEIKAAPEIDDGLERIDRAGCGGAQRGARGADAAGGKPALERMSVHASGPIGGNGLEREPQPPRDALVGVMRLRRGEDRLAGVQLAGDPQRFEVRHRAATTEV